MAWLLVEDDVDIRNVVSVMMQLWGEKPLALADGNAAWKWLDSVADGSFKGELPELALLDIRMPGHTGDQVAARIRQTEPLKHIPIVLMTAFTLTEVEVQNVMQRAGGDRLIKKPLPDMDEFRTTLYQVRDEKRKLRTAAPAPPTPAAPSVTPPSTPAPTPAAVSPTGPTGPTTLATPTAPLTAAVPGASSLPSVSSVPLTSHTAKPSEPSKADVRPS